MTHCGHPNVSIDYIEWCFRVLLTLAIVDLSVLSYALVTELFSKEEN
jgi:hypothetical protein